MTPLPKTGSGAPASSLAFGTMQFGAGTPAQDCAGIYEICRTAGINVFDTAHVYTDGASEKIIGKLIASEREDIVLMTKCAYTGSSSAANILAQFDQSRARLGQDMVDVLFLHRWDPDTALEETFEALAALRSAGKIRAIGVSNFAAWQVMKAQQVARSFGTSVDVIQPMYSLVKRQAEVEILPMCVSEGIAVTPYSPLGGGLLTGKYAGAAEGRLTQDHRYKVRYEVEWFHQAAAALSALAADLGTHPATLAVAWAGYHEGVTAPLVSGRTIEQLRPSIAAAELKMDAALYERISALSVQPAPATDRLEER